MNKDDLAGKIESELVAEAEALKSEFIETENESRAKEIVKQLGLYNGRITNYQFDEQDEEDLWKQRKEFQEGLEYERR